MIIKSIENTSAYHYSLETFGERRETCWLYEPYMGGAVDSPMNGPAPFSWDISVQPNVIFKEAKTQVEVPHTSSVKPCHECATIGKRKCVNCLGDGQIICMSCSGSGRRHIPSTSTDHQDNYRTEECMFCNGRGRRKCMSCYGEGQIRCETCQGRGQLRYFIQLTVTWKTHIDDYIVERTSLPDELIRSVSGQVAFEEQLPRIWPVNNFPDEAVNKASADLIQQHINNYHMEKLIQQRHRIRVVPVSQVFYSWRSHDSYFFVYGFENQVYAPDYPQQCCCGCSIL